MSEARQAVDRLLEQDQCYQAHEQRIAECERRLARQKLRGTPAPELAEELQIARLRRDALSDQMRFASPLIWVMYKYEAYQGQPQALRTMHDFRLHCAKPGYICTKRMAFLNATLLQQGHTPLSDDARYPDDMTLTALYPLMEQLSADEVVMRQWQIYEYYEQDGAVRKWQNYPSTDDAAV